MTVKRPFAGGVLMLFGGYFVVMAVRSLGWHMYLDSPILLYAAFLIDRKHLVPYRDFFDMNLPGTYAANVLVGRLSGYSELGVRWVDLLCLAALLAITYAVMRRFSRMTACCATIFFGDLYLASGEWMSLQREYLLLFPISAAVALVLTPRLTPRTKAVASGILTGVAATIRPDAVLALPVLLAFVFTGMRRAEPAGRYPRLIVAALVGFALPVAGMAFYLWRNDALGSFADMALNYWPLYNELSGSPRPHVILSGASRFWYVLGHALTFGPHPGLPLLAAGSLGAVVALRRSALSPEARRAVWLLMGLAATFWVHVAIGGKFWDYHWLPFNYFAILLGSLGLVDDRPETPRRWATVPVLLALLCIALPWPVGLFAGRPPLPFAEVEEISTYLREHLAPGDTVAPLDWTEGAVHAMLRAEAVPATPFLYDFHFYHHVSSAYIQRLRQRFLSCLEGSPPRYILRMDRPGRFAGPDTSEEFPELTRFLSTTYDKTVSRPHYEIWQRRPDTAPSAAARGSNAGSS